MPIRIVDVPDPFTHASQSRVERPPFIESDAYRQLVHELRRYCNREVSGRSFLIAGHRGSGKTTLMGSAFDALIREYSESRRDDNTTPRRAILRPLPVLLQGPTLLPSSEKELPLNMDGTGEAGRHLSEMENVLVQITLGLHRAVSREIVDACRKHVARRSPSPHLRREEMRELAMHLQIELDDYTGKARLREIWRRCGALRSGVLYAHDDFLIRHDELREQQPRMFGLPPDQGLRELVGVATVCDAYRRISGKISRKDATSSNVSGKTETTTEVDAKGKELAGPLIAALTGAAVGSGAAAANVATPVAVLAGVLTALAGMIAGKVSVSHKRERSASLEDLFIPDLSVATLDRILPVLLERLREAGLAPVFVIDELDKVEGLSVRILEMIRRLKKMVAENAFFCFLADRSYFEEMRQRSTKTAYSIEHTYFTHQLFVSFRHADVRRYLEQVLAKPADSDGKDPKVAAEIKEEQADHAVLPYILMHNAHMHPIDLLRQLAQLRNADGNVILGAGLVRSKPRYQLELLLQLAIELQLEQDAMQEELDRNPAFRRLAHDAMYYVSRRWERDEETLSIGAGGRREFEQYLIERMAVEKKEEASEPAALVSGEELNFLWTAAQALVRSLAAPASIQTEYEKRGTSEVVVSAMREAIKLGSLLEPVEGKPDVYRWKFRRSGRRVVVETAAAPVKKAQAAAEPEWRSHVTLIRDFESALKSVSDGTIDPSTLSAGLGILPTSPAWPQVSAALVRLGEVSAERPAYPEMEEDIAVLDGYRRLLDENIEVVALSLYCAKVLTNWSPPERANRLRDALEKMSYVLALEELGPGRVRQEVTELTDALRRNGGGVVEMEPPPMSRAPVRHWVHWIQILAIWNAAMQPAPKAPTGEEVAAGWDFWRVRLGIGPGSIRMLPVVTQGVAGTGVFAILRLPLTSMTLRHWSVAFLESVLGAPDVPPWLAFVALRVLGWNSRLGHLLALSSDGALFARQEAANIDGEVHRWLSPESSRDRVIPHLLIASEAGGMSESWKLSANCAALVLRPGEWSSLREIWSSHREAVLAAFGAEFLALDASGSGVAEQSSRRRKRTADVDIGTIEQFLSFLRWFGRTEHASAPIPVIAGDQPVSLPPQFRVLRRPKSLDEIVQTILPPRA